MEITCVEKNVTKAIILRSRWRDGGREITTKISLPARQARPTDSSMQPRKSSIWPKPLVELPEVG